MRTEDLVTSLSRDTAVRAWPAAIVFPAAIMIAAVLAALPFYAWAGLRDPVGAPFASVSFGLKAVIIAVLLATAAMLVVPAGRPGARVRLVLLAIPLGVLGLGIAFEVATQSSGALMSRLVGQNALKCLVVIPLLSVLPLVASLAVMARGAPTEPQLAGAVSGVLAGVVGAAIYAVHCPDDSPLFLAAWYVLAIGGVTIAGALLGPRVLRW